MQKIAITHEFRGSSLELYWRGYFDPEHVAEMDALTGIKEREVLVERDEDGVYYREQRVVPERQLPAFLRKVTREISYVEKARFERARNRIDLEIVPSFFADRTSITAVYTVEQTEPDTLLRTYDGVVEVRVALIGPRIERAVARDMEASFAAAASSTQAWLDAHA